jgi:hypothetical protein
LRRLYDRRGAMMDQLLQAYKASRAERDQRAARATGGRER